MRLLMWNLPRFAGAAVAATVAAAGMQLAALTPAAANGPTVNGAGSTWVQIALDQWRADIAQQGYSINYQGVGSSAGRQFFIINQVDFAASEIPFYPSEVEQLNAEHKAYQYLPDVAGGTSLMYNLHTPSGGRITSLRLDANTAAKIFTGVITSWQDPAIAALNPGLQISETSVTPVIRSDGSGTSAQFSLYLANQAPAVWNAFVTANGCAAPCSVWPTFNGSIQQNGSDGVANFVSNGTVGNGSIGYVEAGYAFGRGFPVASLHNASGNFTQPTYINVAIALQHATLNADLTQNLNNVYVAPESNAYPMSSYSYMITQTTGFDPAKGAVLGTWLIYIACLGQQEAAPLGYSPLSPNLVQDVFNAVQRIPGAPAPPPLDAQHCPNPTLLHPGSPGGATPTSARVGNKPAATGRTSTSAASSAQPSASASATASAGGLSGGLGGTSLAPGTLVATLSAAQRQAAFVLAEQAAARAVPSAGLPLLVAAAIVLIAVFGPALFLRRHVP